MLARDLCSMLSDRSHHVAGFDLPEVDICRQESVDSCLGASKPDIVINCAAYTNVDRAESEAGAAYAVNRDGAMHIAKTCRSIRVPMIHISTDYVFDGSASKPYREDESVSPLGVYGLSKWEGEDAVRSTIDAHYIIRTAWLYGVHGKNFVKTILNLGRTKEEVRVVSDQYGCPTWTQDLSDVICRLVAELAAGNTPGWGTYHFCGGGITTWHALAERIIEIGRQREPLQISRVIAIPTEEYPTPAKRPRFSALDCQKIEKALGITAPRWQDSLSLMMANLYDVMEHAEKPR
jgi:dTDP-4-dehydrorhamnose reductase